MQVKHIYINEYLFKLTSTLIHLNCVSLFSNKYKRVQKSLLRKPIWRFDYGSNLTEKHPKTLVRQKYFAFWQMRGTTGKLTICLIQWSLFGNVFGLLFTAFNLCERLRLQCLTELTCCPSTNYFIH